MKFLVTGAAECVNNMITAQLFQAGHELAILAPLLQGYCEAIPHYPHFIEAPEPVHCLHV